jgi:hypothetical protein
MYEYQGPYDVSPYDTSGYDADGDGYADGYGYGGYYDGSETWYDGYGTASYDTYYGDPYAQGGYGYGYGGAGYDAYDPYASSWDAGSGGAYGGSGYDLDGDGYADSYGYGGGGFTGSPYDGVSDGLSDLSNEYWQDSIDYQQTAYDAWNAGDTEAYWDWYTASENAEWASQELYDASWDAYYGPVNSEGYTQYDAAQGYTTQDSSYIEPATAADDSSLISDNDASSWL